MYYFQGGKGKEGAYSPIDRYRLGNQRCEKERENEKGTRLYYTRNPTRGSPVAAIEGDPRFLLVGSGGARYFALLLCRFRMECARISSSSSSSSSCQLPPRELRGRRLPRESITDCWRTMNVSFNYQLITRHARKKVANFSNNNLFLISFII